MDQEAFEMTVEKALEDVFQYYPHLRYYRHTDDERCYYAAKLERKYSKNTIEGFIITLIFIMGIALYFMPENNKFSVIAVAVLELIILIGGVGVGLVALYEKLMKIRAEKIIGGEAKEKEKQKMLETLSNLNTDLYKEAVRKNLNLRGIKKNLKNHSIQEANKLLAKEDIRKRLCPALKSATDDVFDISKSVTPVLVGCVVAGTISIPLNPVLFAAIIVVIARMGISVLCAGYITK